MPQNKSRLLRLPSLADLEARAEEELSNEPVRSSPTPGITEIICPILERYLKDGEGRKSARIHINNINKKENKVVCEKHTILYEWYGNYSKCDITDRGCPYSTLHSVGEKPK